MFTEVLRLNEKEFIKEHPGLRKREILINADIERGNGEKFDSRRLFCFEVFEKGIIHETQIDKQKVKESLQRARGLSSMSSEIMITIRRIEKELGLEKDFCNAEAKIVDIPKDEGER